MATRKSFVEQPVINDNTTESEPTTSDDEGQTTAPRAGHNDVDALKSQVTEQEKNIRQLNTHCWDIMKQYDLVKDFIDNHKAIISQNERAVNIEKEKHEMHREIERLKNDTMEQKNEIQELKREMQQKDKEVMELRAKIDQNNTAMNKLRVSVENNSQGLKDITTNMDEIDKQREVQVNDLKRECLQKLQEDGDCLKEKLKKAMTQQGIVNQNIGTETESMKRDLTQQGTVIKSIDTETKSMRRDLTQNGIHIQNIDTETKIIKEDLTQQGIDIKKQGELVGEFENLFNEELTEKRIIIKIKKDSEFYVWSPDIPGGLRTEQPTRLGGFRSFGTDSQYVNRASGEYKTPAQGKYTFGGRMDPTGRGKLSVYLCSDRKGRQELVKTDTHRCACEKKVSWECEEGECVWLEVVRMEGKAEVWGCEFYGHLME